MTAPITANQNIPQQAIVPDFKPSFNAVQLNIGQPTLNVPPMMPAPMPETATQAWNA